VILILQVNEIWPAFEESCKQFARVYTFKFLPLGFFSRLFVRTMNIAAQLDDLVPLVYWRDGMVLESGGSKAIVEYNPAIFRLSVRVRIAPDSDTKLLNLLMENIDTLIRGWFREQIEEVLVPCTHCIKLYKYDSFMFPLQECELTIARGKQYVYCRGIRPVRIGTCRHA
jgi:hypothetical protein